MIVNPENAIKIVGWNVAIVGSCVVAGGHNTSSISRV